MKKKLIALVASVALIFAFTGCGTGPDKADKEKTATAKSEQAKDKAEAEKAKAEAEKAKAEAEKEKAEAEKAKAEAEKAKTKTTKDIGVDKATTIALKDAGLSKGDVKFTKQSPGEDDGVRIYEIEFTSGGTEYEYNIDAATGKILERDSDSDYDGD
jgi:uncharacterized membrane protein YkoI